MECAKNITKIYYYQIYSPLARDKKNPKNYVIIRLYIIPLLRPFFVHYYITIYNNTFYFKILKQIQNIEY